jgi:hypothetical protein
LPSAGQFPAEGGVEEQFLFLLRYAVLAPSTFNTQPWHFRVSIEGVELYGDYTRRLPVADPAGRELLMSIGAAVMNLRVAAAFFDFGCEVVYNHSGSSEEPLAFVNLLPGEASVHGSAGLSALFPQLTRRHTNRKPFLVSRVPASVIRQVQDLAVSGETVVSASADGKLNDAVAGLVAQADRLLLADPAYRRDVAEWLRPNDTLQPDGMRGEVVGLDGDVAPFASWTTRVVDPGKLRAAYDRNLCVDAPGLIAIAGEDTVPRWLAAGEFLERMLLLLTAEGIQHSYFNMPVQVPALRRELKKLLGLHVWPQLLLRIGYSLAEPVPTPRRPITEFLLSSREQGEYFR